MKQRLGGLPIDRPFQVLTRRLDLSALHRRLVADLPDLVFNLVESLGGQDRLLFVVTALLDSLAVPYTGSPTAALFSATDKLATKRILESSGLPVPPCLGIWPATAHLQAPAREPASWDGPVILKSIWDHGSPDLDDDSVFPDLASLEKALAEDPDRVRGSCFAEPYIAGRELNISLLAAVGGDSPPRTFEVLPAAEIHFSDFPPGKPRIVGFRAKWQAGSFEYQHTPRSFTFPPADSELLRRLADLSHRACAALGIAGYGRVDFRVAEDGSPYILEVNANPCLSPDAGFAAAVAAAGLSPELAMERIVAASGARPRARPSHRVRHREEDSPARRSPAYHFRDELTPADPTTLGEILTTTGFFRPEEVEIGVELVREALDRGAGASGYHFLIAELPGRVVGYSCFGPIPLTDGSWDLYWIAVDPDQQGRGLGRQLLARSEHRIRELGGRRLFVDTSARPDYAPTRAFYRACGYHRAAGLRDFYAPGDGKVVFRRDLADA